MSSLPLPGVTPPRMPTAVIYCEANFGANDGKTANGLVRHSEKYEILAVIDSEKTGEDSGVALDGKANSIPICRDLADARRKTGGKFDSYIYGVAPASGLLSTHQRSLVLEAIASGMNIVNGLHEFFNDDAEFSAAAKEMNVTMTDVRRPRAKKDLRLFKDRISEVTCPRIAVLGTDCAIGKRTTATLLTNALKKQGINAVMVGTGQTGLIQGARYGVALDSVPAQFCAGEMEAAVLEAYDTENPDVIIIEGQGALSHPAYSTSSFILRGSKPNAVILQHAPGRANRCDFDQMPMPSPTTEIHLIQLFSKARVIGLTLNHENMSTAEVNTAITKYELELGIPTLDPLNSPSEHLARMVLTEFTKLKKVETVSV